MQKTATGGRRQRDLTPQVGEQVTHAEGLVHADVAAVVELPGVQIPPLDKPVDQRQGWTRE